MNLTKLTQNEEIPILVTTNFHVNSFVKGYHVQMTPKIGEILSTKREPGNLVDKYSRVRNKRDGWNKRGDCKFYSKQINAVDEINGMGENFS